MKFRLKYIFAFLLVACSPDLGNYTYSQLDEPKVSQISDVQVLAFSRLQLSPAYDALFDASLYDFEWKAVDNNTLTVTVLGTGPKLDCEVDLTPGKYALYFTISEKNSGIFWRQEVQMTVSSSTSEGWMVLCSDSGRTRLDFVSSVTGETYTDILAATSLPQWYGPRKIQWLSSKTDASSPFYLFTDQGATRLGKDAFEWKPEYDFSYEVAVQTPVLPQTMVSAGVGKVVVSNGNAHYCEVMGFDGLYGSAVNKTFKVAPYVGANVLASEVYAAVYLLYDVDNKRFMAYCPLLATNDLGGLDPLMQMDAFTEIADGMNPGTGVLGDAFAHWPEGYDCLYMENTRYDPGNAKMGMSYAIMTDGSRIYLYGVQLGDIMCFADCTYVLGKGYYGDLSGCENIAQASCYAFSSLKNYMYYAHGGDLYRVNLSQTPLTSELQLSLEGEDITLLKFNLYQNADNMNRSYDLIVATDKDGMGTLRVYDGSVSDGDFSAVQPKIYSGFAPIVDVTYKERVY